jgi:hypothetical protein
VSQYITAQRGKYAPRAVPLSAQQRAPLEPFFAREVLNSVRVLVLRGQRVSNPEFYPMLRGLGFKNLPDQSAMGAEEVGGAGRERKSDRSPFPVLAQLLAQNRTVQQIAEKRDVFLSRQASQQFRGLAEAQVRRLQGIGTGKKGQQHELIGVHGYDIEAAMHVIRLLNEGIELMRSGAITLPRPEKELLITIRTGKYGSLERVLSLANGLFRELEEAETNSRMPEKVDRARISELVSETYLRFWADAKPAMPRTS